MRARQHGRRLGRNGALLHALAWCPGSPGARAADRILPRRNFARLGAARCARGNRRPHPHMAWRRSMNATIIKRPFDVAAIRAQFPILSRTVNARPLIYLDNAASAQKPEA